MKFFKVILSRFPKNRSKLATEIALVVVGIGFLSAGALIMYAATLPLPDFNAFEERKVAQSTKIYDRNNVLLYDIHQNIKRAVVPGSEISDNIKHATIAIEDRNFFTHHGIQPLSILRAVGTNALITLGLMNGYTQGGSTITQQVIKNSLLTKDKKISRKIKEWILAIKLERVMEKDDILSIYLNESPYGGNIYGVEEASKAFFGIPAKELSIAQSAYLAALPQAPTYYSPYGNNRQALENRKNTVLREMLAQGYISSDAYTTATTEQVTFLAKEDIGLKAPHFVFFVRSYLEEKYGKDAVENGGLVVTTTLDWELQKEAEAVVKTYALQNEKTFNAENAAVVALDPRTGHIRAMVGSRDYFDKEIDGKYNIAIATRQPGSTMKPIVYAAGFEKGYTSETILFDLKTQFGAQCRPDQLTGDESDTPPCYAPDNYDNLFRGPMTVRNALAQSINVPAVKMMYLVGLPRALELAKKMGISTLKDPNQYGLTLVLGGGEVKLLEMTSAYATFAADGTARTPTGIISVKNNAGETLETWADSPREALSKDAARTITNILSDNTARTPAFGSNSPLHFGERPFAAKTGTTNDYKDAWIIGYTPSLVVGAWAGNNDNTAMEKKVAGFIVAPLWRAVVDKALKDAPIEQFTSPAPIPTTLKPILRGIWQGGDSYTIDIVSGKLATEHTPEETRKEIIIPGVHDILYWVSKNDPQGPAPANPGDDSQFNAWEYVVGLWAKDRGFEEGTSLQKPTTYDDIHTPEKAPRVTILPLSPSFSKETRITPQINHTGLTLLRAEWYVDGRLISSTKTAPFSTSFTPLELDLDSGEHTLRVVVSDAVYNKGEAQTTFIVE